MINKIRLLTLGLSIVLFTGCSTVDDLIAEYVDDEGEELSSSTLYLKDTNGIGVAGIAYSCNGGDDNGIPLDTSGNTSSTGDMAISYWPGYDVICTITPVGAPALYLYDANGPITNPTQVDCNNFHGYIGEDGVAGSINNASSDSCRLRLLEVIIN